MIKFEVDEAKIRDVTNENLEYQYPEELIGDKNRLIGMIENHVMFCSLVTGYRGTGKSSFVRQVLRDISKNNHDKEKILVIDVNATKYTDYTIFIKRFIRELFLEYSDVYKKEDIPDRLRSLYLHTFFDIKQSLKMSYVENKKKEEKESKKSLAEKNVTVDYSDLKSIALILLGSIAICIVEAISNHFIAGIVSFIFIIFFAILKGFQINHIKKRQQENVSLLDKEDSNKNENDYSIETLFDDEIAEYHLYHEIEEAKNRGNTIVFILDELDKIEDEDELRKIFHELKPLFLSNYCDVILIAGKNMDKYLASEKEESDSVVASMFSQQIYVPLSTIEDMKTFAYKFLKADSKDAYSLEKYINQKIINTKGNKRRIINSFLSDITWEGDQAFIYYDNTISDFEDKIFVVLDEMERYLFVNYRMIQRDEALYHIFDWIEEIRRMQLSSFDVADLSQDDKINQEICGVLLKKMEDAKLIKINDDNKYFLLNGIKDENSLSTVGGKEHNIGTNSYLKVIKSLTNILINFGEYNELVGDASEILSELRHKEVVSENDFNRFQKYIEDSKRDLDSGNLDYIYGEGERSLTMSSLAISVESLAIWTIRNKSYFSTPIKADLKEKDSTLRFDMGLVSDNESSAIIAEIKYYSDIFKMIVKDYYALIGRFLIFKENNPSMNYHFYMLYFTDTIKKEDRDRLLNRINDLRKNAIMKVIDLNIFIVSIANLKEDMNVVINSINSKDSK